MRRAKLYVCFVAPLGTLEIKTLYEVASCAGLLLEGRARKHLPQGTIFMVCGRAKGRGRWTVLVDEMIGEVFVPSETDVRRVGD